MKRYVTFLLQNGGTLKQPFQRSDTQGIMEQLLFFDYFVV